MGKQRALMFVLIISIMSSYALAQTGFVIFAQPTVGGSPASQVDQWQEVKVDVEVANVTDLIGIQLDVTYDSNVLTYKSIAEGNFLSQGGATTYFPTGSINTNVSGEIANIILLRLNPSGVTGSGILVSLYFNASNLGTADLGVTNILLSDGNGINITTPVITTSITVIDNSSGGTPTNETAPVVSNGAPSGTLAAGTTQATMSVATNENATCRYSNVSLQSYAVMPFNFTTTGAMLHLVSLTNLTNGTAYAYYVKCQDQQDNVSVNDYPITFAIDTPSTGGGSSGGSSGSGGGSGGGGGGGGGGGLSFSDFILEGVNETDNRSMSKRALYEKENSLGLTGVAIYLNEEREEPDILIEGTSVPSNQLPNKKIFSSFEVKPQNFVAADTEKAIIGFKVTKEWLAANNVDENSIILYGYVEGQWQEVEIELVRSDESGFEFIAETGLMTQFAIAGEETEAIVEEIVEVETPTDIELEKTSGQLEMAFLAIVLLAILSFGAVGFMYRDHLKDIHINFGHKTQVTKVEGRKEDAEEDNSTKTKPEEHHEKPKEKPANPLASYISKMRAKNVPEEEIKKKLLSAGWDESVVDTQMKK